MPRCGFDRKYRLFAVARYRVCLERYDPYPAMLDTAARYAVGEISA